jgi:hypothetical protein
MLPYFNEIIVIAYSNAAICSRQIVSVLSGVCSAQNSLCLSQLQRRYFNRLAAICFNRVSAIALGKCCAAYYNKCC